jgi:hypothetical protein
MIVFLEKLPSILIFTKKGGKINKFRENFVGKMKQHGKPHTIHPFPSKSALMATQAVYSKRTSHKVTLR